MSISDDPPPNGVSPLDRARGKAYRRLLPILFCCYVIAYVDRNTVGLAKLKMIDDLAGFNDRVIGFGVSCFFIGYLLLEIPGTLLVERWSARKWISRIMITWGMVSALTALIKTPYQFYGMRFALGLAEAGFFPGVIVYLTHWFPVRDRARALSWFLVATPIAQMMSPRLSYYMLRIGTDEKFGSSIVHHPMILGLKGWQWVYIGWGIPAVILGAIVLAFLTDRPRQARWLLNPTSATPWRPSWSARRPSTQGLGPAHAEPRSTPWRNPEGADPGPRRISSSVTGNYGVEILPAEHPGRVVHAHQFPERWPPDLAPDDPADRFAGRATLHRLEFGPHQGASGSTRPCRSTWGRSALTITAPRPPPRCRSG